MIKILVSNKKAFFNYEIIEKFEAGIVLKGTEIKSLRAGGGSLQDAYIIIKKNEAWLLQSSIAPYEFGASFNHEERRERKLLLHKKEINKLKKSFLEKSLSIIPLSFYLKNGVLKVKIATGKGKKSYDKRACIKERESKKNISRLLKS